MMRMWSTFGSWHHKTQSVITVKSFCPHLSIWEIAQILLIQGSLSELLNWYLLIEHKTVLWHCRQSFIKSTMQLCDMMHSAQNHTCFRRFKSSKGAEVINTEWCSLCKFITRYCTVAVLKICSFNLFQQTLSFILQKRSIDCSLSLIPSFIPAMTPSHTQHDVYSMIHMQPLYTNMKTLQGSDFIFNSHSGYRD